MLPVNAFYVQVLFGNSSTKPEIVEYFSKLCEIEILLNLQNKDPGVVFCGDLNSASTFGVYQLLTTGKVPGNHADWWSGMYLQLIKLGISIFHVLYFTFLST